MGNAESKTKDPNTGIVSWGARDFTLLSQPSLPSKLSGRVSHAIWNEALIKIQNITMNHEQERVQLCQHLMKRWWQLNICGLLSWMLFGPGLACAGFLPYFLGKTRPFGLLLLGIVGCLLFIGGFGAMIYAVTLASKRNSESDIWWYNLNSKISAVISQINQLSLNQIQWSCVTNKSVTNPEGGLKITISVKLNSVTLQPGYLTTLNINNISSNNNQMQYGQPIQQPISQQPMTQVQYPQPQQIIPQQPMGQQMMMVQLPNGQMQQVMVVSQPQQYGMQQNIQFQQKMQYQQPNNISQNNIPYQAALEGQNNGNIIPNDDNPESGETATFQ